MIHALRAFRYRNFRLYFSGQSISLLGTTDDAELAWRFNGAPRAAAHILRGLAAWVTSDFDAAARDAQEAAAEAERADDAMTQGFVCGWAAT